MTIKRDVIEIIRGGMESKLENLPTFIVRGVKVLWDIRDLNGPGKKALLIDVLQELCPNDHIDALIPPFIDMVYELLKHRLKARCGCLML